LKEAATNQSSLQGIRILVVEDEFFLAHLLEEDLRQAGADIIGPLNTLARALEGSRRESFDIAVLDVNLGGEFVYPLADELRERGIPFVFLSGYGPADFPERFRSSSRVAKPYDFRVLLSVLQQTLHRPAK
jgi:two-component system, response regulator PdtaR